MYIQFRDLIKNYDRPTDQPSNRQIDQSTDGHWEVTLPITWFRGRSGGEKSSHKDLYTWTSLEDMCIGDAQHLKRKCSTRNVSDV